MQNESQWMHVVRRFKRQRLGMFAFWVVLFFCAMGIFAPFLASSKPIFVVYNGEPYFPLFRYLFFRGFYSKAIDLYFNLMIFTVPLFLCAYFWSGRWRRYLCATIILAQLALFTWFLVFPIRDPASDISLVMERKQALVSGEHAPDWNFDLKHLNDYARLNRVVDYALMKQQDENIGHEGPTLWQQKQAHYISQVQMLSDKTDTRSKQMLAFLVQRRDWLEDQSKNLHGMVMPLISHFHWEEDAGGSQKLNHKVEWWQLTRVNRKDLMAALIFGVRISLVVGFLAVGLALVIGIPVGAIAGYYAGFCDIVVCRLMEVWEGMPTFFMLLAVVAMTQSKSIFLVISVIGFFGWTGFSRFIRGEFFKQRQLPYVDACRAIGFHDFTIMFRQILPNALPPVITLLPFAVMGAITSEAGLSFLGLGEEGSSSWGVLMDEGRNAFPAESYLLWPPAILLTVLLIAIALVGDAMRDALDPKS